MYSLRINIHIHALYTYTEARRSSTRGPPKRGGGQANNGPNMAADSKSGEKQGTSPGVTGCFSTTNTYGQLRCALTFWNKCSAQYSCWVWLCRRVRSIDGQTRPIRRQALRRVLASASIWALDFLGMYTLDTFCDVRTLYGRVRKNANTSGFRLCFLRM